MPRDTPGWHLADIPENAPAWILAIILWVVFIATAVLDLLDDNDKDKKK